MDAILVINKIEILYGHWGNIIIFLGSLIETLPIGFLIPGGLIVALGGFFSYGEKSNLVEVIVFGTLGMLIAFIIGYLIGKKTGLFFIKKFHQEKNAEIAKNLLKNHGPTILTTSLLANLIRFWVSFISGVENYSFPKFVFYASVASLTWNSLLVTIGFLAGSEREKLEMGITRLGIFSWIVVLIASLIIFWSVKKEYKLLKSEK